MDTQEISRDKPKPAASDEAAATTPAPAAEVTPRMALASVPSPAPEPAASETVTLARVEAPRITPDIDEIKPAAPAAERPPAAAAAHKDDKAPPEPPVASPQPRVSRFTLLAATLALAAALGGLAGALAAYGLARPASLPAAVAGRTDLEELQALKENVVQARVELAALRVNIESASRSTNTQFTRLGERIERLERLQGEPATKLNKAIETLDRLSRDAAQPKEVTGSVAAAATAPGKPGTVDGWVLRDVHRGTALIEGRMGLIEIEQGDVVPGLGRVDAIRKQDGRWVVVTPKGVITSPR